MELKEQVLYAIYNEYLKEEPDMFNNINHIKLDINERPLKIAVKKLQNEGFIQGAAFMAVDDDSVNTAYFGNIQMTRFGIEYVEKNLNINISDSKKDKARKFYDWAKTAGIDILENIAAKALVEFAKSYIPVPPTQQSK